MAVPPKGTGAVADEVLYDLLEVRIMGWKYRLKTPDVFVL
jgi:hypothetical protein